MKRNIRLFCLSAAILMLTGCSAESIIMDENVKEYNHLISENMLDDAGYYINDIYKAELSDEEYVEGTAEETMSQSGKSIHIVMCSNKYLNLSYYIIEKSTGEKRSLDSDEFYAEPGDIIHIEWKTENPVSSMYELDAFNIYKFVSGTRSAVLLDTVYDRDNRTAEITFSDEGNYSIEPVGKYLDRILQMNASVVGQNFDYGSWEASVKVDENNYKPCDPSKMDPTKDYKVTYTYPNSDYYIESCTPDDSNVHEDSGVLTFGPYPATSDVSRFDVVLRNYLRCRVQGEINAVDKITVDGADMTYQLQNNKESDQFAFIETIRYHYLEKMKVNSKVVIDIKSGYELDYTELTTSMDKQSLGDGSTRYTFQFTESDTNIALLFIHKPGKNSAIEFIEPIRDEAEIKVQFSDEDNRHVPKTGEMINPDQNVTVTISPKDGYYFTDESKNEFVVAFRDYSRELSNRISNYIKKYSVLTLSTADDKGKLSFQLDGEAITENTISAKQGQKLTFIYTVNDSTKYQIECRNNAFWDKYKETFTYTFEVTPELDGKLINIVFLEEKFNFGVVEK